MSNYQYDDILQSHLRGVTKVAFWGALARGAVAAAPRIAGAVRAAGPMLTRANAAVQPVINTAQNIQTVKSLASSANNPQGPKIGSLREKNAAVYSFKRADWKHHAGHLLPYAGFMAAHGLDAAGHPNAATALNLASLGGLAAHTGTKETPDLMDQAAIGLFGLAELHRLKNRLRPTATPAP